MFVNFSNHPSEKWQDAQMREARKYGEVRDLPFPPVGAGASEADIASYAEQYAAQIAALHPDAVLCQGEYGLTFAVVHILLERRIKTLYACSERSVEERVSPDGSMVRVSTFVFVQFRMYQ